MRKLYLIAGHGAGDPGAEGNGYTEAERVRALAARIKALGGSNVILLDTSRNWYADAGINTLSIPSNAGIAELHMDSGPAGARGGHVIIKAGLNADEYDKKLADAMARIFPGRASTLVGRSDLANVNRAAARGINYRLVENGFISNAGDVATYNRRMDDVARAYLDAFGVPEVKRTSRPTGKETGGKAGPVYRIYNPNSGEHFYSQSAGERDNLKRTGWKFEGVAWTAPATGANVYRMYNPNDGRHHYTESLGEAQQLWDLGWTFEGVAFKSGGQAPIYRAYNPANADHLLTASKREYDGLPKEWKREGVALHAIG